LYPFFPLSTLYHASQPQIRLHRAFWRPSTDLPSSRQSRCPRSFKHNPSSSSQDLRHRGNCQGRPNTPLSLSNMRSSNSLLPRTAADVATIYRPIHFIHYHIKAPMTVRASAGLMPLYIASGALNSFITSYSSRSSLNTMSCTPLTANSTSSTDTPSPTNAPATASTSPIASTSSLSPLASVASNSTSAAVRTTVDGALVVGALTVLIAAGVGF
ncbi:hypothetical protein BC936DRAFT_142780, partial [Jimgerdemannia flammicorona]